MDNNKKCMYKKNQRQQSATSFQLRGDPFTAQWSELNNDVWKVTGSTPRQNENFKLDEKIQRSKKFTLKYWLKFCKNLFKIEKKILHLQNWKISADFEEERAH